MVRINYKELCVKLSSINTKNLKLKHIKHINTNESNIISKFQMSINIPIFKILKYFEIIIVFRKR